MAGARGTSSTGSARPFLQAAQVRISVRHSVPMQHLRACVTKCVCWVGKTGNSMAAAVARKLAVDRSLQP